VERGLTPEAGHGEAALATAPARGFVHVAGVTILLENIVEYELVDGAELALTLLRSHGLISRNDNANREDPAGPEIPVPDAQLPGPCSMRFAAIPHSGSWSEAGVLEVLERYAHPFLTSEGQASKSVRPTSQTGLAVEGEGVVLTSLRRRDGWLEARVVAEHPRPARARLSGAFRDAREVDLLGRTGGDLPLERNGELVVELGPWEIRTLQVR
jgi:alpha-mannosidase